VAILGEGSGYNAPFSINDGCTGVACNVSTSYESDWTLLMSFRLNEGFAAML
jgi:hypothetical protein